jgi:hypothetical protein
LKFTVIFDKDHSPQEIAKLIEQENISYVFSCLGMKKQEERLVQIWDFLPEITPVV